MKKLNKDTIKQELEKPSLDTEQLNALLALQETEQSKEEPNGSDTGVEKTLWTRFSSVALLVLMLGVGFWLGGYQQNIADQDLPALMAYEVVSNHLKDKPMDLQTKNFKRLQSYFTELDFKPFDSKLWSGSLIGGRYCSLRTVPSAQIRYFDAQGNKQTLYQAEYSDQYFSGLPNIDKGEQPLLTSAKGVDVFIWVEKGVVFVDTQSTQQNAQ